MTLLTHINYAHGRFHNPTTRDGGIEIASPEDYVNFVTLFKEMREAMPDEYTQ